MNYLDAKMLHRKGVVYLFSENYIFRCFFVFVFLLLECDVLVLLKQTGQD